MFVGQSSDLLLDIAYGYRVDTGKRFVKHDQLGVVHQTPGNFQTPTFPTRDSHGWSAANLVQAKLFEQLFQTLFTTLSGVIFAVFENRHQVLFDAQLAKNRGILRQVTHPKPGPLIHGQTGNIVAIERHGTAVGIDQPDGHPKAGRFACSVGA